MRTTRLVAALAALLTLLAACSGGQEFNDADVAFASEMIPHHEQATEMAALAQGRTENPDVLSLADRIAAAQEPEIATMTGWLEDWGQDSMDGMDHSSMSMPGMMSDDEMSALADASGPDFDRLFLTMMIAHHEGAIEMAETQQADGQNTEAIELAKKIADDQSAEIAEMEALLG